MLCYQLCYWYFKLYIYYIFKYMEFGLLYSSFFVNDVIMCTTNRFLLDEHFPEFVFENVITSLFFSVYCVQYAGNEFTGHWLLLIILDYGKYWNTGI